MDIKEVVKRKITLKFIRVSKTRRKKRKRERRDKNLFIAVSHNSRGIKWRMGNEYVYWTLIDYSRYER